jgi:predicted metalloprotease with PDZ domain
MRAVLVWLVLVASRAVPAPAQRPIDYLVRVENPGTRLYHVEATLPASGSETLVSLPAWTPGFYEIENYARYVRNFAAEDDGGAPLRWKKTDKDTWLIHSEGASRVRVSFDYPASQQSLSGSVLLPDFGVFNGTNLFVYPETGYDFPARVRFELPEGWCIATELEESGEVGVYRAADYHQLVDNPTFIGHFAIDSAQADGRWTRLAVWPADALPGAGRDRVLDALRRIADYSHDLFDGPPYERYTTLLVIYPGQATSSGGLEHANSQLDVLPAAFFKTSGQIPDLLLDVLAHEYYHAWNVKRIRPAEMWPYDYSHEQYSPLLWVSEGFTSYYGPLILLRSGLHDEEAFWADMRTAISEVEARPYQASVEDVSLETWIEPVTMGSDYYYPKGALIGLLLDIQIRDATDNRHSLDDVMRRLYHEHYLRGRGFTTADLRAYIAEHIGDEKMDSFYRDYIDGRERLPYQRVLALAGMSFGVDTIHEPRLGVFTDESRPGVVRVESTVPGSSAVEAGLQPGDELVRVGVVPIVGSGWAERFREIYADSTDRPFTVEYRRNGQPATGEATLRTRTRFEYRIEPAPGASERQLAVRRGLVEDVTR